MHSLVILEMGVRCKRWILDGVRRRDGAVDGVPVSLAQEVLVVPNVARLGNSLLAKQLKKKGFDSSFMNRTLVLSTF